MLSGEVPRILTPAWCSRMARLFGTWPPIDTITPTGLSRSQMAVTVSNVISSKISMSETS
jgi:hypothetical protein